MKHQGQTLTQNQRSGGNEQHALPITIYHPRSLEACNVWSYKSLWSWTHTEQTLFLKVAFGWVANFAWLSRSLIIHTQVTTLLLEIRIWMYDTLLGVYKQHRSFPEDQRSWARTHPCQLLPPGCLHRSRSWSRTDRELSPDSWFHSSHGMQPLKTQNYFYPWAATAFLPHKDCWSWCLTLHTTHPEPNQLRCMVPWHLVGFLTAQLLATGQSSSAPGIIVSPQKSDIWSQLSKLEIPQKCFALGDKISSVQWLSIWFVFYTTNPSLHLTNICKYLQLTGCRHI